MAALILGWMLVASVPSQAQEEEATGGQLWRLGGCFNCHGLMADGVGEADYPAGPNLMRSALDRDQLIATIACGRPNTQMPMNLVGAYTEIPCYGFPLGDAPDVPSGADFTMEEIETLVDFLLEVVVGQSGVSREYCAAFYGGNMNAPACFNY